MPSKMKLCEDYRTALIDAAAGAVEPSLELRSHLDVCASCREAFAEETQLFSTIDTGVRSAANAEVPVSLLPSIRVQLNVRPAPRPIWVPAGAVMTAAVALAAVLLFVRGFGRDSVPTNPAVSSSARNSSPVEIQPSRPAVAPVEATDRTAKIKPLRPARTPRAGAVAQVENARVLVPAGQQRAMDALLADVLQGKVDGKVLLAERPEKTLEDLQVAPLDVSPIELKPLVDVSPQSATQNEETRR